MDRFIAKNMIDDFVSREHLKSSMDRFIGCNRNPIRLRRQI